MNVISYSTKVLKSGKWKLRSKKLNLKCEECDCLYEVSVEQMLEDGEELRTFGLYIPCPECGLENYTYE